MPSIRRTVTEIQKRRAGDVYAVYIDGEHAFDVDAELLFRLGLKAGEPIDAETEANARKEAEFAAAKRRALRLLTFRSRTRHEMERRLIEAGFHESVVAGVCDWLEGLGYLDDEAFAREWVDARVHLKPMGAKRLALELRRKGVSKETAQAAIESITPAQEEKWAYELASRRLNQLSHLPHEVAQRRLAGYLERRGFRHDVIRTVISKLLS